MLNVCTYMCVWVDACRKYFSFLSFFILASIDVDFVGSQLYFPEKVVKCYLYFFFRVIILQNLLIAEVTSEVLELTVEERI